MLDNNKCILAYNVPEREINILKEEGFKVILISSEMTEMTIRDILDGLKFETFNSNLRNESVILFNNFSDEELKETIRSIRQNIKGGILATVTPVSIEWKFNYLVEHLVEEREWYLKQQKGRSQSE
ncbi:hypothetical protein SDC9_39524 [bioreactor metagenome]|jgi:hypothetical protein|uniref:DUF3783 domain-containing protein n=2 Tax=root TaxID=1 RepID=R9CB93_9CLOT|nr:DUF3783 domain-containing protein [Clostridium sartagoforme]EOR26577.1 hypothetical protein A500_07696 [Clostridium sartagoforme AAU1]